MSLRNRFIKEFIRKIYSINEVYKSAVYGASHSEVKATLILKKFGSTYATNRLSKKELSEALKEINAINKSYHERISIEFTSKEVKVIKKVILDSIKRIREVPILSREQAIISFASVFEGYMKDILEEIFEKNPNTLKSERKSLTDKELIDTLEKGGTLTLLRESKIREVMYGSVEDWIKFFNNNLSFDLHLPRDIVEMYLVRNCLIHNNGVVSHELEGKIKRKGYICNKKIKVTTRDYKRYMDKIQSFGKDVGVQYIKKFGSR